jgi:hypothetical protein
MNFFQTDIAYGVVGLIGLAGTIWLFVTAWRKSRVWVALYGALILLGGMIYTGRNDRIILGAAVILGIANVIMIVRNASHAAFPLLLIILSNFAVIQMGGFPEYKKRFPAVFKYIGEPPQHIDPIGDLKRKTPEKPPTF